MDLCDRHALWQVMAVACCWLAALALAAACAAIFLAKTDPPDAQAEGGTAVAFLAAIFCFFSAFFTLHVIKECVERRAAAAAAGSEGDGSARTDNIVLLSDGGGTDIELDTVPVAAAIAKATTIND